MAFGLGYRRGSGEIVEGSKQITVDIVGVERTGLDHYDGALWVLRFFTVGLIR